MELRRLSSIIMDHHNSSPGQKNAMQVKIQSFSERTHGRGWKKLSLSCCGCSPPGSLRVWAVCDSSHSLSSIIFTTSFPSASRAQPIPDCRPSTLSHSNPSQSIFMCTCVVNTFLACMDGCLPRVQKTSGGP